MTKPDISIAILPLVSAALAALLLAGCGGSSSPSSPAAQQAGGQQQTGNTVPADGSLLPYVTVGSDHTAVGSPNIVLRDSASWLAFWTADQAGQPTPSPLPAIDFDSKLVAGVYAAGDACTHLNVSGVWFAAKRLTVEYAVTPPAPNALCIAGIAIPRQLVVFDRYDLPLFFANTGSGQVEASFRTIAASAASGVTQAKNVVVRDTAAWTALPAVDFSKYMVIGVFGGPVSACGGVAIKRIVDNAGRFSVSYIVTRPGPATMCVAGVSSPGQLVLAPLSAGDVQFLAEQVEI